MSWPPSWASCVRAYPIDTSLGSLLGVAVLGLSDGKTLRIRPVAYFKNERNFVFDQLVLWEAKISSKINGMIH